ncbi:tryptophan synthase subunit alpha [compost metagenome]
MPIGVGFGIRDAETARAISTAADAVVVGSRLVQEIEAATPETAKEQLTRLVASLKDAIR